MNPTYGYQVVVTPAGDPDDLAGTYSLTNVNSGLQLATLGGATASGTPVVQADPAVTTGQVWKAVPARSGPVQDRAHPERSCARDPGRRDIERCSSRDRG